MVVPVQKLVEIVDLSTKDTLLLLFECIVNSIISLMQSNQSDKVIQIKIIRADLPTQTNIDNIRIIHSILISDNGIGFNEKIYSSFQTPFSKALKDLGKNGNY